MKKNEIRAIAFVLIVLIAFNVVVFALPFVMNGVFWVSYIFGMLAILLQLPVMKIAFKNTGITLQVIKWNKIDKGFKQFIGL